MFLRVTLMAERLMEGVVPPVAPLWFVIPRKLGFVD